MSRPRREQRPQPQRPAAPQPDTSWEKSADWYDRVIGAQGSEIYRSIVIPRALDLLEPMVNEHVLDLGCGQGVFARTLAAHGCDVTGVDAAPSLIEKAKSYPASSPIRFVTRDAAQINDLGPFDAVSAILCLQNMPHLDEVCAACAGALRDGGRMLWVMNHPCFRVPRQTSWGYDEGRDVQFRRLDAYSSRLSVPIVMHPGQQDSETTLSFHHNLTVLMAFAFRAGFVLSGLEEWHSDKQSEPGPRARAENRARNEFPLFIALLWTVVKKITSNT